MDGAESGLFYQVGVCVSWDLAHTLLKVQAV